MTATQFTLSLVGIGTGNPKHLTLQAVEALNAVDLILIPNKGAGKDDLAALRQAICAEVIASPGPRIVEFDLPQRDAAIQDYQARVDTWHDAIADLWWQNMNVHLPKGGTVGFLVWGDPSLYDSTMRIADRLQSKGDITVQVVPGVTSIQALTAAHAEPLNQINESVTITTGRQLRDHGWPPSAETLIVMLDGQCSFQTLPTDGTEIWWTAYAGMENEISVAGPLSEVTDTIKTTRAKARADHGWLMDIYMLRKAVR